MTRRWVIATAVAAVLPVAHAFACVAAPTARSCAASWGTGYGPRMSTASAGVEAPPALGAPETFRESGSQAGVYVKAGSALATRVLPGIEGLRSWAEFYKCPAGLSNGHVHTILASQWRRTANVCYARTLLPTPDGGTVALDMLKSVLPEVLFRQALCAAVAGAFAC